MLSHTGLAALPERHRRWDFADHSTLCHLDGMLYFQLLVQRNNAGFGLVLPDEKSSQVFIVKLFKPV